mmetsp:Transcript_8255/g.31040  ORF Transcript_8255/g.31040 Transcript_8255/m.31040 type:complete len:236 (-) Transcript_8255:268-975(-)|eukprot:scaffold462_cov195-Pinguiococcus_pyrenoidosus.AAC.88
MDRPLDGGNLEELAAVVHEMRVFANRLPVRLEIHDIHFVEADERHEQAHVCLRQLVACDVPLPGQDVLAAIQRSEEVHEGRLVGLLGAGEATAVDAVVDAGIDPGVDGVDLLLQVLRAQVELGVLAEAILVERRVEHADDLRALVADDAPGLLVPEHGHGVHSAGVLGQVVQLANSACSVHRVGNEAVHGELAEAEHAGQRRVRGSPEDPAGVVIPVRPRPLPRWVHHAEADDVL